MTGLRHIGVWCALVGVTALLTLLFSFLGTLSAAVVTGLIAGASKRWQWSSIPISLVFPGTILALSHYSKIELPPGRVNLVALVSIGAYWGVCGMMIGLHFLERKEPSTMGTSVNSGERGDAAQLESADGAALDPSMLLGIWTSERIGSGISAKRKTLRVEDGKFVLLLTDSRGRSRVLARGTLRVSQAESEKPVIQLDRNSAGA